MRWIRAKWSGNDINGRPFRAGECVLFNPTTRKIVSGEAAHKAAKALSEANEDAA